MAIVACIILTIAGFLPVICTRQHHDYDFGPALLAAGGMIFAAAVWIGFFVALVF